jgi:hypothetical protein
MPLVTRPALPKIVYSHPACSNLQFAFVAGGSLAAYDFQKRQFGTITGTPTAKYDPLLGNTLTFTQLNQAFRFASRNTLSKPATIAVIVKPNLTTGGDVYFQSSNAASGITLANQVSGSVQLVARNVAVLNPTLPITANPYLIVSSIAANNTVNLMTVRLDTGVVATATSTNASSPTAGNGTFVLGNTDVGNNGAFADIAACLFSNTFLSLGAMLAWAKDPWGPWRGAVSDVSLSAQLLVNAAGWARGGSRGEASPSVPISVSAYARGGSRAAAIAIFGLDVTKLSGYAALNASSNEEILTKLSDYAILNADPNETTVAVTKFGGYAVVRTLLLRPYLSINT